MKVEGRFLADLLPNGIVQMQFVPNGWNGNAHPLVAKGVSEAEGDLVSFFDFTPAKAQALIADLEKDKHVDGLISIDEAKVPALFSRRSASA